MDNQDAAKKKISPSVVGAGMALGLVFGGLLGLIVDNLVVFAGGGMVLGLAMGTAIQSRRS
jgi:hypothetical protein